MTDAKWAVSIHATNDVFGEGMFFLELADVLEEYAGLLRSWKAAQKPCESFVSRRGTKLVVIGATYSEEPAPLSGLHQSQPAQQ